MRSIPVPTTGFPDAGRNRLTLHVGAHQRAVRVVVLQNGISDANRNDLPGADVHVLDARRLRHGSFRPLVAAVTSSSVRRSVSSSVAFACAMT